MDALTPVPGTAIRLGLGLQVLRWRVASTNTMALATGAAVVAGNARWNRTGAGPVATWTLTQRVELEARMTFSRYGQEDRAVRTTALGLLWHF